MKIDVVLPAGGRIDGPFATETGVEVKTLIAFNGRTILERTIDTLRSLKEVQRIVIIGPAWLAQHPAVKGADIVLPEADSGVANIYKGLDYLYESDARTHAERVLILTTDMPFITPESIKGFLDVCPTESVVTLPIMRKQEIEERFPGLGGSYIRLCDGDWTMGGAFLVNPVALLQNRGHIEKVYAARKSGVAMAMLLGPRLISRFLCRRAHVSHVLQRCEQILGCTGAAVRGCAPELAFDIDLIEEYHYAVKWLAQQQTTI